MNIRDTSSIFLTLSNFFNHHKERSNILEVRAYFFDKYTEKKLVKVAFDTRRVNQETEYNPRRGLQYYHRSEPFVSKEAQIKIAAFSKLNETLTKLKTEFEKVSAWQDSYARILYTSVNNGLRTNQNDGDFSENQASMGSLNYLNELLYVRYRLTTENIMSMSENDLRNAILSKDEALSKCVPNIVAPTMVQETSKFGYDQMMHKMLDTMAQMVALNKRSEGIVEQPTIKETAEKDKTITITIKV